MLIDGIEFTAEVKSFDIEIAHMVVDYTPTNPELMPMTLNVPFIEDRAWGVDPQTGQPAQDLVPKTFEDHKQYSIEQGAPVQIWRRQKLLIENI
jgi:hypothetical protein